MTKDEWIWVAIRIFGIYMLVLAVMAVPDSIAHIYSAIMMPGFQATSSDELVKMIVSLKKAAMGKGVLTLSQVILFSFFSYYLLKNGKLIHKLASSENA